MSGSEHSASDVSDTILLGKDVTADLRAAADHCDHLAYPQAATVAGWLRAAAERWEEERANPLV